MSETGCLPRENPYRSGRIDALRFRGPSVAEILERWERQGRRGALVGPCGSGKSTLLRELHEELRARGHAIEAWSLRSEERPPGIAEILRRARSREPGTILSIDGAEQLGVLAWQSVRATSRRGGGIIITSHSSGRLPILHSHGTTLELVIRLIEELEPGRVRETAERTRVSELHRELKGNIREVFHALYLDRAEGRSRSTTAQRGTRE